MEEKARTRSTAASVKNIHDGRATACPIWETCLSFRVQPTQISFHNSRMNVDHRLLSVHPRRSRVTPIVAHRQNLLINLAPQPFGLNSRVTRDDQAQQLIRDLDATPIRSTGKLQGHHSEAMCVCGKSLRSSKEEEQADGQCHMSIKTPPKRAKANSMYTPGPALQISSSNLSSVPRRNAQPPTTVWSLAHVRPVVFARWSR